eukprot:CAMPEP_0197858798 /NCGR_PEP_ID=MMETSP1438-20131217/32858_1 /TAXON_ID=1461541 /ORGANISM="Pterosperma sp., Strain CCMP1384" /LENGTH=52 /DNA_ID=CAMNT_0043475065 /DNA_START=58 /DNA_END=213 /DNA_ORIENTATION=-
MVDNVPYKLLEASAHHTEADPGGGLVGGLEPSQEASRGAGGQEGSQGGSPLQ